MYKNKKQLLSVTHKVEHDQPISPQEITILLTFTKEGKPNRLLTWLKRSAVPTSLFIGVVYSAFPHQAETFTTHLPAWTNFPPSLLSGIDFLWDLIGDPVGKANILYHLPNIVLYSFGIFGVKSLLDKLDRRTWLNRVLSAQTAVQNRLDSGYLSFALLSGHSILFVGKGDFIGRQFCHNHAPEETITISENKPIYTHIWNAYDIDTLYEDLKNVMLRAGGHNAGEYIFFPVKDDQIFLPGEKAYDLSPHKLDLLCQNIRTIEKELRWKPKRIIIIGDKFHKSFVQSEDRSQAIAKSEDTITLQSIAEKYKNITILDPSDVVLQHIIRIAQGRKVVFRATKEGLAEYKARFYSRLDELGYKQDPKKNGVLTIGYDLFEDQTEQQTLARKVDDYYPVVLSKSVHDALIRNKYKKRQFLYVPDLVLQTLSKLAAEQ